MTALPEAMRVLTAPPRPARSRWRCRRTCRPRRTTIPRSCSASASGASPRHRPDAGRLREAAALIRARQAAADRGRRRRDLQRGDRRAARASWTRPASRSARRWPARAACPTTIRSALGAIGVTGHVGGQPDRARRRPGDRRSARATATSRPPRRPPSRTRRCASSTSTSPSSTPPSTALPLVGDAQATIEEWLPLLDGYDRGRRLARVLPSCTTRWEAEVERIYARSDGAAAEPGRADRRASTRSRDRDDVMV